MYFEKSDAVASVGFPPHGGSPVDTGGELGMACVVGENGSLTFLFLVLEIPTCFLFGWTTFWSYIGLETTGSAKAEPLFTRSFPSGFLLQR